MLSVLYGTECSHRNQNQSRNSQDYITWLKQQRIGPVYIDISSRSDATEVPGEEKLNTLVLFCRGQDIPGFWRCWGCSG